MDAALISLQPASAEPLYRQITGQVRRLVASGQLAPGQALPSVREVAGLHAINPMTVSRAYSQLEAEGVLVRLRGRGMVVAERADAGPSAAGADARWRMLAPALDAVARQARELELSPDEVADRLRRRMQEETP